MTARMEYAQPPVVRCLERMEPTVHEVVAASARSRMIAA